MNKKSSQLGFRVFATLSFLLVLVFAGMAIWVYTSEFGLMRSSKQEVWGQFGDYIGGLLNPFVAFIALIAILYGLMQQRKELSETRDQFAKQSIDGVFFQMLKLHNDMVSSIDSGTELLTGYNYNEGGSISSKKMKELGKGRETFKVMFESMKHSYWDHKEEEVTQEHLDGVYMPTYQQCQSFLGHYFRYLYNVFQFIDSADIKEEKKFFYGKLVRAQLSNHELAILYYNCLSALGKKKFKPLAEQYGIFKNLPIELLLRPDHFSLYEHEAWGSNYKVVNEQCESIIAKNENIVQLD